MMVDLDDLTAELEFLIGNSILSCGIKNDRKCISVKIVGNLIGIVAKGGNLALNVSPQPDGELSCGDSFEGCSCFYPLYDYLEEFGRNY